MIKKMILLVAGSLVLISACRKEKDNPDNGNNTDGIFTLNLLVENVGLDAHDLLELGKVYPTPGGDSVSFDAIRYWLSNLELVREDGSTWKEANSYRLMEQTGLKERLGFSIEAPSGKYKGVRFSIGVDADHNSSLDSITGELNASLGMSWTWQTGYIFMYMDGQFYHEDSMTYKPFKYHIGMNNNYKTVNMDFPAITDISKDTEYELHVAYKVLSAVSEPNALDRKTTPVMMTGPANLTALFAENYAAAFVLHHFKKKE